jgi:hypothetical protein
MAECTEFDFEKQEWRIPPARMKMRALHVVPLAKQAIVVLQDLQPLTGDQRFSERAAIASSFCSSVLLVSFDSGSRAALTAFSVSYAVLDAFSAGAR